MPLFPPSVSRRFLAGWLLPGLLLGACRPDRPEQPAAWWLPAPLPIDTLTEPASSPRAAPAVVPAEPAGPAPDTLVYTRQGCYFYLATPDTFRFFPQLPRPRPLPGFRIYQTADSHVEEQLPRHFRLADIQVEMYRHETMSLSRDQHRNNEPSIKCATGLEINAWTYYQSLLEFPQLRTAAGPLRRLNQELQGYYELEVPDNPGADHSRSKKRGAPIWPFGLSAAELARRPYYVRVDSSQAPEAQWRSKYRLLDTTRVYERYPHTISLVQLGRHRLLGLTDRWQDDEEPHSNYYDEAYPDEVPAYFSLRLSRRVGYDDLFRPALTTDLQRAMRPLLLRERQRLGQARITPAHWQALARPRHWYFTRHGWYAVYLADDFEEDEEGYPAKRYRLTCTVLIPYARLRAYLRP